MKSKFELGGWGLLALFVIYFFAIGLYFEYIFNREVDQPVQAGVGVLALVYTTWQVQLLVNYINKITKTKEK
jgi:hypothetical protein